MNASAQKSLMVGVDVGGTKVAAGLVDSEGEIRSQVRTPMSANGTAEAGLAAVKTAIDALLKEAKEKESEVGGIGICAPGPLDPATGIVINPPNLPCWRDFPLSERVAMAYSLPVKVDNDANAAALAEVQWGAGRGYRYVFYATLGTGIGTGIVFDGKIYHGRTGAAGEGGHMSIDYRGAKCGCGKLGCIETFAAGPAIAKRARARLAEDGTQNSAMLRLANGSVDAVTSEMVGKAAAEGDAVAKEVLDEVVERLTFWTGNIIDLLDPDVVIFGGGVSGMVSGYFGEMQKRLDGACVNPRSGEVPIVQARYGADAGIAGGAALGWGAAPLAET